MDLRQLIVTVVIATLVSAAVAATLTCGLGDRNTPSTPAPTASVLSASEGGEASTLHAVGSCRVTGTPDVIYVTLTIIVERSSPGDAMTESSRRAGTLIEALRRLGVQDANMTTTRVSLDPVYDYKAEPPRIVGYRAVYSLRVRVTDPVLAGRIIDEGVSLGVNEVGGPAFGLSEEKRKALYLEALKCAVADARAKAEAVASAAGLTIVGVRSISIGEYYYPRYGAVKTEAAAVPAPPPVMAGEYEVTATVTVTYEVSP